VQLSTSPVFPHPLLCQRSLPACLPAACLTRAGTCLHRPPLPATWVRGASRVGPGCRACPWIQPDLLWQQRLATEAETGTHLCAHCRLPACSGGLWRQWRDGGSRWVCASCAPCFLLAAARAWACAQRQLSALLQALADCRGPVRCGAALLRCRRGGRRQAAQPERRRPHRLLHQSAVRRGDGRPQRHLWRGHRRAEGPQRRRHGRVF
jgi:hypothetical protein